MCLRIVFMGTPAFAVASLDALVQHGYNVVGVITAPDKPAGRGMKLTKSAVKIYAEEHGLHILQPEKLKNPQFVEELRALQADLQVVVAFRMLPEIIWNMPPRGTINVHASLLPQYRGAAPINWAIINGEKTTGVTTFRLKHEIDTGNILLQQEIPIEATDTAGTMHDKIMIAGANLLLETLKQEVAGTLQETNQEATLTGQTLHHAPKIFTETCEIDWGKDVHAVDCFIRGLAPYPGAFTWLDGKKCKLFRGSPLPDTTSKNEETGSYLTDHSTFLHFRAANGYYSVEELQLEGKRKMQVEDFLRGWRKA